MDFYPVYRMCRATGAFTRIGSLMESRRVRDVRHLPSLSSQARALFARQPEDVILLGPRCDDTPDDRSSEGRGVA